MTTLITGAAGFIGSHLARRLLAAGERVVALDNFNDYYEPRLKRQNAAQISAHAGAVMIEGDVRDASLLRRLMKSYDVRRVAHLAAMAGVRNSMENAALYMDVNTMGTLNVLEAARHQNVETCILASTSSVYGATQQLPFREDDPADRPLAAYPASKRAAEILAHSYHHLFGLPVTVLRFFNVYGPAGRPDMMPLRLMNAITRGEPITVFNGGDLQRDWTYIEDTVEGVCTALERPLGYEIINLGLGQPISLNAFITTIEALAGKTATRIDTPTPPSDPPITFCDNQKARRLLGFDPQTPVAEGLAKTWAWFVADRGA